MPGVEKLSFGVEELSSVAITENANVWNDDNNSMCITNSLIIFMVNPYKSDLRRDGSDYLSKNAEQEVSVKLGLDYQQDDIAFILIRLMS
jgi:hypothetical protein